MARTSRDRLRQARLESRLQTGPERSALNELLREARSNLLQGVQVEEGAARGIKQATREARPQVKATHRESGEIRRGIDDDLARAYAGLGSAADAFRAASEREKAGSRRRSAESQARTLDELSSREVDAESGRAFAVSNLLNQYRSETEKVRRRMVDLAREQGTFTAARVGALEEADEERSLRDLLSRRTERGAERRSERSERGTQRRHEENLDIKRGIDPVTGRRLPGGGMSAEERRMRRTRQAELEDQVGSARNWVRRLRRADRRASRGAILDALTSGQAGDQKVPTFPTLALSVALDLEFRGLVSERNRTRLKRRTLKTAPEWRRKPQQVVGERVRDLGSILSGR